MSSVEQNPNKELEKEENVVSEELNSEIETQEKSVGVTSRKRERSEEVEEEASVPSKNRETSTEIEEDTAQPKTVVEEEITLEDNSTKTVDKVTKEEESVLPNDESLVPQTTDSESLQKEVEKSNEDTKVDNPETNGDAPKSIFGSKFSGFSFGGTPAAGTSIFSSSEDKPASFESLLMSGSSALDADESKENGAASNEIGQGAIPKMDLQKVEVTTGEEGEDTLFQVRAKLFVMDAETKGWKERGIGSLKLNVKHNDKKSARLIMRTEGVLKAILNVVIFADMKCEMVSDKYVRIVAFEEGHKIVQYTIKVGSKNSAEELCDAIEGVKSTLSSA